MEIELKLSLDPDAAGALRAHPLLAHYRQARPWTRELDNQYFDTPALDLQRNGVELRLRREGGQARQTLKVLNAPAAGTRAPGGLHRLEEWEAPLAKAALDIPALLAWLPASAGSAASHVQAASAQTGFCARVATRFRRTTWALMSVHGDLVELALDIGEIRAGAATLPLCEVELELKGGRESALFELAHALQAGLPLRPEWRGKAERGFALLAPQPPAPPRPARAPRLSRDMPWEGALRAIVEECLAQVQANEAGVVGSPDPEYVHQMRVGLRRLRAGLGLFKALAVPPQPLLDDLGWVADRLGQARDAEVLAHETLPRVPPPTVHDAAWQALQEAAAAAAGQARALAAQAVCTPRHVRWQLALMAWVCGLDGASLAEQVDAGGADAPRLPALARRQLQRLRKQLARAGRRLADSDAGARHDTRIAAKKLRYAGEMLGTLQRQRSRRGPRSGQPAAPRALVALQERLGGLNDAEVAMASLARMTRAAPQLAPAAAYVQGWLAAKAGRQARGLGRIWRRVQAHL